jgi:hypothetical protein
MFRVECSEDCHKLDAGCCPGRWEKSLLGLHVWSYISSTGAGMGKRRPDRRCRHRGHRGHRGHRAMEPAEEPPRLRDNGCGQWRPGRPSGASSSTPTRANNTQTDRAAPRCLGASSKTGQIGCGVRPGCIGHFLTCIAPLMHR